MTAQAIGLGAAVDYLTAVGMDAVAAHEHRITQRALDGLAEVAGVRVIGPLDTVARGGAVSFVVDGIHPHDVGQVLDSEGVAVRVGHHCAWPLMRRFAVPATTRATFYLYTTEAEIDALVGARPRGAAVLGGGVMQLEQMYQEIILDHYRRPQHRGLREPFDVEVHHVNPTCGDEVTVRVLLDGGTVERRLLRRPGLLDQPGQRVGDDRPGHRASASTRPSRCSRSSWPSCRAGARSSPTRRCSRTPWRSRAWRSSRRASSARCSGGWHSRTRPLQAVATEART